MHLNQLMEFIGHFMGAVLQLILIMMMARRKDKRHSEKVFFTLVVAIFIWHAGSFVSTFSELLTGERIIVVGLIWDTASALSMGFVPPLLIHTLLTFLEELPENFFSRWRRTVLFVAYAPLPFFWRAPLRLIQHPELPRAENIMLVTQMFEYWTIVALAIASYMCYKLSTLSRDDVQRRFYISLVRMFVIIFGLMVLTHVLYAKFIPGLGTYFLVACALAPMFPTIIFSYFILRYNYMEYVLKRSIFYSLLAIFVLAVYILGIRQVGDFLERALDIDFRIIEAILVIGLILLIDPVRERLQAAFNALFFREQSYYQRVFAELSHRLGSLQGIEVGRLLRYVANSVQTAMRLSNCKIILLHEENGRLVVEESSSPVQTEEVENIVRHFQKIHAHSISLWQVTDQAVVKEMKNIDATLILPIYRDGRLAGVMSLGPSLQYRELYEGEIEILSILLNHLVTAIDNTRLMQDKLEMERRMLANEKWMSLGRLSGQIAHEVKNPLSSIKAITHVMREELPPDDRFYKDLAMVEGEIDKLTTVVNQLLRGAHPTTQTEKVADLRDIIENVSSVLRPEASHADIRIICQYDNGIPAIKADPVALREIIFNVMNNGIQSMASGGTLTVSVSCLQPDPTTHRRSVLVSIHDTGPGIPEEDMSKIFEPFYTTKEGGTGLGLWIVREKLTDLGGSISVESNGGTTITITIPVEAKTAVGPPATAPNPEQEKPDA
ncbi:MAG: hypothetical protein C4532_09885 [Candidatus Abyssobacteria bacterium SURF_17]|uniref:histidine kinase n=1 Tax=Candidatus Abyssobacteria bacterium SURF_17 TaxID=2093361 RepID=A0A419EY76_9BACT|nr:MAG: hypothetical protein C4532_09885 [Candidatus Abyssubacteria bacterium SURF_17]